MLRLFPKALAAAAVLGTGVAWAQVDAEEAAEVNAAKQNQPESADANADADADIDAAAEGDINGLAAPPRADADADADVDPDVGERRSDDGRAPDARIDADADAELDANRPRDRDQGDRDDDANIERDQNRPRAEIRGDAETRGRAQADITKKPALGVSFRNDGDAMVISRVHPNSPAARMGLRPGDRIVSLNGQEFDETDAFVTAAGAVVLDEDAEIVYMRGDQRMDGTVRFAPWSTVYVEDGDDLEDLEEGNLPRRVGRPELDEADDLIDEDRPVDTAPRTVPDADDVDDAINNDLELDD
jgi:hypothetical protein